MQIHNNQKVIHRKGISSTPVSFILFPLPNRLPVPQAAIAIVVKRMSSVARTLSFPPHLLVLRTMVVWVVLVSYILEEINVFFWKEERGGYRMHRRVAPSFIVKASCLIKVLKE
jgi:hypothetical protein